MRGQGVTPTTSGSCLSARERPPPLCSTHEKRRTERKDNFRQTIDSLFALFLIFLSFPPNQPLCLLSFPSPPSVGGEGREGKTRALKKTLTLALLLGLLSFLQSTPQNLSVFQALSFTKPPPFLSSHCTSTNFWLETGRALFPLSLPLLISVLLLQPPFSFFPFTLLSLSFSFALPPRPAKNMQCIMLVVVVETFPLSFPSLRPFFFLSSC